MCCSTPFTNTSTSSESAGAFDKVNALVLLSPVNASAFTLLIVPDVVDPDPPVIVIVFVAPDPVAVTLLPTPTTMDHLPQRGYESMVKQTQVHRKGRTKLANLREAVNPQTVELFNKLQNGETPNIDLIQTGEDMLLNPAFVEEMMGYPIGYCV